MAAAPAPSSQQEIRRRNLSRVLHAVAAGGPVSRAAVATRIGLTRAAVSTLVDELLRAGLLVELGPGRPGGVGRPGSALALTDRGPCGLGAEIGVDRLAVCAVDLRGEVRAREVRTGAHRDSDPAAVLARLAALTGEVAAQARAAGLWPAGLAVAVPGLVARDSTTVVRAPNLGWPVTDLAALLPEGPRLTVDNEANFGALAELWLGGAAVPRDFVHVSAQIGIGGAIVLEGGLLRGVRGFAGELGHVPVRPEGPRCGCGGRGCLETYAGEEALLRAAGLPEGETRRGTALLAGRAGEGDAAARRALRGAGRALGVALTGVVNLLDPGTVVLGGALAGLGPWLLPALEGELARRAAAPGAPPALLASAVGPEGPLLGAAHSVVRAVLDDPLGRGVPAAG
ncbi:ROK family transcriptional regulator [Streptomyces sp. JJ36]|uniref:ROK family transcriptional regulator n=1 Tax=Streptomyces sp. JJ36 TaxID=2736645 RepID=UPI001F3532D8|nr:ROK family transcriptional regulator [Streptomyces sp. JJ36]MCF6525122.1 ROK family transcriptional regulator [Streptomyces sp. JJ36]